MSTAQSIFVKTITNKQKKSLWRTTWSCTGFITLPVKLWKSWLSCSSTVLFGFIPAILHITTKKVSRRTSKYSYEKINVAVSSNKTNKKNYQASETMRHRLKRKHHQAMFLPIN